MEETLTPSGTTSTTNPVSTPKTRSRTRGARWMAAWVAWLAVAVIALGLFALGIPARFDEMRGQYQGQLGLDLSRNAGGQIVLAPWWEGAAARAGILSGDILVAVDGVPVTRHRAIPPDHVIPPGDASAGITLSVRTPGFPVRRYVVVRGGNDGLALSQLGLSSGFIAAYVVAIDIVSGLLFVGIAVILIWRRADNWLVVLVSMLLLMVFLGIAFPVVSLYRVHSAWQPALDLWFALGLALMCTFFYLFPDGRPVPRWTLVLMGLLLLWISAELLRPDLYPWKQSPLTFFLIVLGWLITGVLAQLYRLWRHADAMQRQQTKWVVFGAGGAALGITAEVWHVAWFQPSGTLDVAYDLAAYPLSRLLTVLLPLSIGIAILRHRLWDVDVLINRALVYGSLTASLVLVYVAAVVVLQTIFAAVAGQQSELAIAISTLVIAALFNPLRHRFQAFIDQRFYRRKYDAAMTLTAFQITLRDEIDLTQLSNDIVGVVQETMQPAHVSLWLR